MKHILVVDDDLDIHALFKIHFRDLNCKLHFATDVDQALIHLEHDDIAFIFLDIIIGDNETSYRILRNTGDRPIFLMSSHITESFSERVLKKNQNILDCLSKPFGKTEVMRLLIDHIDEAYGSTKFNPNDEVHFIEGHGEDIGEDQLLVKGEFQEDGSTEVVRGKSDEEKDILVISSDEEEDNFIKVQSEFAEDFDDQFVVVSGKVSTEDQSEILKIKHINSLNELKEQDVLARTDEGYTRLMLAVFLEDEEEASNALDDGVKVDLLCRGGFSALHFAVMRECIEMVNLLVSRGAKLTVKDNYGREPLYFAIFCGNEDIVELLVEAGAPLNRRVKGKTYLMIAVLKRNEVLFKYLLSKGMPLAIRDNNGFNIQYYLKKLKLEHYLLKETA